MKTIVCALLLIGATVPAVSSAADYTVQPATSTLGFAGTFQGAAFNGTFSQWTASISYDAAHLAASKFDVNVNLGSVKTGDKDRDSALPGADFFNIAKFPQAHFVTTRFRQDGAAVVADGNLTLHGITRPVALKVAFKSLGSGATLDVGGSVRRLDFGVGGGDYADTSVIAADIKITAHLQLIAR